MQQLAVDEMLLNKKIEDLMRSKLGKKDANDCSSLKLIEADNYQRLAQMC